MTGRFMRLWGWPIAIGLITLLGLIAGLIGDDIWDLLAATALALPVLAAGWLGLARSTQRPRRRKGADGGSPCMQ